ncbi:MAG: hypothetical protein Q7U01_03465 [Pseudomonas sp.]|nr:hypothetical protein [Pseudomonas sp.]
MSRYPFKALVGVGARPRRILADYLYIVPGMTIGLSAVVNGPEHLGH